MSAPRLLAGAFALGAVVLLVALVTVPEAVPGAWLTAAWVPVSLALGALSLLAVLGRTGGAWGVPLEPALRAMAALLPLGLALMVPVLFAGPGLFPWEAPGQPEKVAAKLAYLNLPMLWLRFLVTAALLLVADLWMLTRPRQYRGSAGPVLVLVVLVLGTSVLDVDLMLALQPEVVSTIHPMIQISAQACLALAVAVGWRAATREKSREADDIAERGGHMLLGFLILWGYMQYMQWLIVWAEDLPFEIAWYLPRLTLLWRLWLYAGLLLLLGGGLALCSRRVKRSRRGLARAAAVVAAGQGFDLVWRVLPPAPGPGWPVAGALALVAGIAAGLGLFARHRGWRIADG